MKNGWITLLIVYFQIYLQDVVSRVPVRVQQPYGSSRSVQHMVSRSTPISTGMRIVHVVSLFKSVYSNVLHFFRILFFLHVPSFV